MTNLVQLTPAEGSRALAAPGYGSVPVSDRLDFRSVWGIFRRRLRVFLAVFSLVLLAGLAFTLLQTPLYTGASQVSLNVSVDQIAPALDTGPLASSASPSSSYADTQLQVIGSQAMALRVADALKLPSLDRFRIVPAGPARWFGLRRATPRIMLTPDQARQGAAAYLMAGVKAQRVAETYALIVTFSDPDPVLATDVANQYAIQYTQLDIVDRRAMNLQSQKFLASRLEQLRAQAQADTEAVQRYRIAHNIPTTTGANLTEQEISSYNQAVATARAQNAEDAARLATAQSQMQRGSEGGDVGEALQSGVIAGLRQKQADLASDLANLTSRYGDQYPDVIKTKSELAAIDQQIQAEIKRILSNLEARRNVSTQREGSLVGSLNSASAALAENNRAFAGLDGLERRATASQTLYDSYLSRYKEVFASEGTEQPTSRVLTLGSGTSVPTSPRLGLNLALSIVLGTGLGVAAALAAELLFSGLTTGNEVEERLHVRYAGSIPTLKSVADSSNEPLSAIVKNQRSAFAESFRALRTVLDYASLPSPRVIAIASALPKEGKTTSSICLARSYVFAGQSTILVDCDLRRQGVSRILRDKPSRPGLLEVLRGEVPLADAIISEESGLNVLPISGNSDDDTELLTGNEFDQLLQALRQRFAKVILDTPPLLPIADARVIVSKADAALLLVRWRKTPDSAILAGLRMLSSEVNLVGVALSLVDMKKQVKFGYGDSDFHYSSYKNYYS